MSKESASRRPVAQTKRTPAQEKKMKAIMDGLSVRPTNPAAQQFADNFQHYERNPKAHIFLEIEKLANEFFNLEPTPAELESYVSIVNNYITAEHKERVLKTFKATYSCSSSSSKEAIVAAAVQRIKSSSGSLMNLGSIPVPYETNCMSLLIALNEYVGILDKFKKSPLTEVEISLLLEVMKIRPLDLVAVPTEELAFSFCDSSAMKSGVELYLPPLHLEVAKLNHDFLGNQPFAKLIYSCKSTVKKKGLKVSYYNTLWGDLQNVFLYEDSSQLSSIFSRRRIEKAIVGNFGFLQVGQRSPRLLKQTVLDKLISFNRTRSYLLYSFETNRHIQVYEIGHITITDLSLDDKKYEPIRQYLVHDIASHQMFLRYGYFNEKFAKISSIYEAYVVDHYFSLKNLGRENPYLGTVALNINIPPYVEPELYDVFLQTPSINVYNLSDRIMENNIDI